MSQPKAAGDRLTGAARRRVALKLAKAYESGKSVRALVKETGRSYGFVYQLLADAQVNMRPRGGTRRGPLFPSGRPDTAAMAAELAA